MRSRSKNDRFFVSDRAPVRKPFSNRISVFTQDILLPSYRSPGKTGRSFLFCKSSHSVEDQVRTIRRSSHTDREIGNCSSSYISQSDIILLFSHRYLTFPQILDTKR
ncbi:hypothetical protein LEP1GSC052_0882 [Leptospira kmetyi serovar Malaysia str. Bejo-Iso9]|nr:hypothetical protein LEP1GSC052_0882 [Leptospira kmetyi serovar Malaysia str. Bejo-Iso9]